MANTPAVWQNLINWLKNRHSAVMTEEQLALAALDKNDTEAYRAHMVAKATLLATMHKDAKEYTKELEGQLAKEVESLLHRFSNSASMGLKLDSLFFMSALLYPDDHKKGEPDNLACAIKKMEEMGLNFTR